MGVYHSVACVLWWLACVWPSSRAGDVVLLIKDTPLAGNLKDSVNYLEKFGYIEDASNSLTSAESIQQALKDFQDFNGLAVTGELDPATLQKMGQPRCDLPDVIRPGSRFLSPVRGVRSADGEKQPETKWSTSDLTYGFESYTSKLEQTEIETAISNAFRKWSDVTPLTFNAGQGLVDINIGFNRQEHGDDNPFDGQGKVLAHAFFPGNHQLAGDTHFDDDEEWTLDSPQGRNLEMVAAHEFGHALGLKHSRHHDALMAPYYQGYDPNYALHQDDIERIQKVYGTKTNQASDKSTLQPSSPPHMATIQPIPPPQPPRQPIDARKPKKPIKNRKPKKPIKNKKHKKPIKNRKPNPKKTNKKEKPKGEIHVKKDQPKHHRPKRPIVSKTAKPTHKTDHHKHKSRQSHKSPTGHRHKHHHKSNKKHG
ncbi:matrilysin-like isoform X2 [Physella acuta]|uniref:matrilysin-like isoform X2 n=1 Tax=Physella acuta TaxID=109671 RepID=UPI0027DBD749|nr:matrilysin-like isoform X2 [Physella acuta]